MKINVTAENEDMNPARNILCCLFQGFSFTVLAGDTWGSRSPTSDISNEQINFYP